MNPEQTCPVLVVEDDEDIREDLAYLIHADGHAVVTAAHGAEALARLAEGQKPCIILLDLMMPVMDGWQFREELRNRAELDDVPIVVLSGVADIDDAARRLDAIDYLSKPVDLEKLAKLVETHCD